MFGRILLAVLVLLLASPALGHALAVDVNVGVARVTTSNAGGNCRPDWGSRSASASVTPLSGVGTGTQVGNACQDQSWQSGSALWADVWTSSSWTGYDYVLVEWHEEEGQYANYCHVAGFSSFTPGPHNNRFFRTVCPTGGGPGFLFPRLP